MGFQTFTKNMTDESNENGFSFTFTCDMCSKPWKSDFVEYKAGKKVGLIKGIGSVASIATSFLGKYSAGYAIERGADMAAGGSRGSYSPEWKKERDAALTTATALAKKDFMQCGKCKKWVCSDCWNAKKQKCNECSGSK